MVTEQIVYAEFLRLFSPEVHEEPSACITRFYSPVCPYFLAFKLVARLGQAQIYARNWTDRTCIEYRLHVHEFGEIAPVVTSGIHRDVRKIDRNHGCDGTRGGNKTKGVIVLDVPTFDLDEHMLKHSTCEILGHLQARACRTLSNSCMNFRGSARVSSHVEG